MNSRHPNLHKEPAPCPGSCQTPTREPSLRERLGDNFFKRDDRLIEEWLKKERDKPQ